MLRIASIGCGDIAQRKHFPQLLALDTAKLVAIAGRDPARLHACAARFGSPATYTDPAEMLARADIDAVLILTPPDTHADYAEMAVRAGKHVMVEKPLVRAVAEAERLAAAVRAHPPVTFFALPHVETAEQRLVAQLLPAIGEVTLVESHRGHRGPTHADWFYRRALAGGGVLLDLGIYQLTGIAALFGPAVSMTAACTTRFATRRMDDGSHVAPDVEDSALLTLHLADGTAVAVTATWNAAASHHHTRMRTTVFGRAGTLHYGVADGCIYLHRPDGDYAGLPASEPADFDGLPSRRLRPTATPTTIIADFVARIAAGDTSTRSLDIQMHVMDLIAAAYAGPSATLPHRF
jgi:predicted dehydrogenase